MSHLILHSPATTRQRAPPLAKQKQAQSQAEAASYSTHFYLGQWVCAILLSLLFPLSFLEYENRKRKKSFAVYYSSAAAACLAFKTVPVSIHHFFGNYYKVTKKGIRFFQYHNQFLIIDYDFRHRH